jgi:hypothetical protein|tara:strand:+ start:121 stop:405 length:285 start_codon:yes stop_codon:yes gene_type:complete
MGKKLVHKTDNVVCFLQSERFNKILNEWHLEIDEIEEALAQYEKLSPELMHLINRLFIIASTDSIPKVIKERAINKLFFNTPPQHIGKYLSEKK